MGCGERDAPARLVDAGGGFLSGRLFCGWGGGTPEHGGGGRAAGGGRVRLLSLASLALASPRSREEQRRASGQERGACCFPRPLLPGGGGRAPPAKLESSCCCVALWRERQASAAPLSLTRRMAAAPLRSALSALLTSLMPLAGRAACPPLAQAAQLSPSSSLLRRRLFTAAPPAAASHGAPAAAAARALRMGEFAPGPSGRIGQLSRHFVADSHFYGGAAGGNLSPRRDAFATSPLRQALRASSSGGEASPEGSREMATSAQQQRAASPSTNDETMLTVRP